MNDELSNQYAIIEVEKKKAQKEVSDVKAKLEATNKQKD